MPIVFVKTIWRLDVGHLDFKSIMVHLMCAIMEVRHWKQYVRYANPLRCKVGCSEPNEEDFTKSLLVTEEKKDN